VDIDPEDLRIDTYRVVGGPCSVRVTHLPTGVTVLVDDADDVEASRERALAAIRRLLEG
jgi:protein subunit release factor A